MFSQNYMYWCSASGPMACGTLLLVCSVCQSLTHLDPVQLIHGEFSKTKNHPNCLQPFFFVRHCWDPAWHHSTGWGVGSWLFWQQHLLGGCWGQEDWNVQIKWALSQSALQYWSRQAKGNSCGPQEWVSGFREVNIFSVLWCGVVCVWCSVVWCGMVWLAWHGMACNIHKDLSRKIELHLCESCCIKYLNKVWNILYWNKCTER